MEKKQLTLVVVSLLVVVLSVSVAYFTAQIIGDGKEVSVTSANLQIVFEDTDGSISDTSIEPGWTSTKTFKVTNNSKSEYKYNIVIKDLVNTFVTEGYLQYKITSTNNGYNMTEFKDAPKSDSAKDEVLAYSVSIPMNVSQEYTITFQYLNDEDIDQSDDMGMKLSGTLFITEGTVQPTMYEQLLADKTTRPEARTDFNTSLTVDNTNTLYTGEETYTGIGYDTVCDENGNCNTYPHSEDISEPVYYFAGNATDNWVKFGGYYWRIIRTNADGGIRLLYHGTSHDSTTAYISSSTAFNSSYDDAMYVGYMYGTSGTLASNRTNTNDSTIKAYIDSWYKDNLLNYTKYLSTTAIYYNDRDVGSGTYSATGSSSFDYKAYTRLNTNKTPTYDCTNTSDAFSVSNSSAKLTYPIGLMTADEISFAGGLFGSQATAYYYYNSAKGSSTGSTYWYTMTPNYWNGLKSFVFGVSGSNYPGRLSNADINYTRSVRPVTSLKSCVKWASGDGTPENPYTISETESGC